MVGKIMDEVYTCLSPAEHLSAAKDVDIATENEYALQKLLEKQKPRMPKM